MRSFREAAWIVRKHLRWMERRGLPALVFIGAAPFATENNWEMRGVLGGHVIGLHYTLREDGAFAAAHYFYASQLRDIPLTGSIQGQDVELKGGDGGVFHLRFVGNGSNGVQPLTWSNSIGLTGTWESGSRSLPVRLTGEYSTGEPGRSFYEQVTTQSAEIFEARVRATRNAILQGDAAATAAGIHFPLEVNFKRRPVRIHNAAELAAAWPRIFTPGFLASIRASVPHEMFVRNGEAMLGDNGLLWFSGGGLESINPTLR